MRMTGGILAVVAGVYGIVVAVFTLLLDPGDIIASRVAWGGMCFSLVTIGLGGVVIVEKSRAAGVLLVVTSIAGLVWVGGWLWVGASGGRMSGGEYVGIGMILSLLGGALVSARVSGG